MSELAVGDKIEVKGPLGKVQYEGFGDFIIDGKRLEDRTHIGIISAEGGMASCFSLVWHALKGRDNSLLSLVYETEQED